MVCFLPIVLLHASISVCGGARPSLDATIGVWDGDAEPGFLLIGTVKPPAVPCDVAVHRSVPACILDLNGRICDASQNFQDLLRIGWADAVGERFVDICVHPCFRQEMTSAMAQVLEHGTTKIVASTELVERRRVSAPNRSPSKSRKTVKAAVGVLPWRDDTAGVIVGLRLVVFDL